ncbi:hypothetical protein [Haloplanus vescus]|nr:hypothetical protein [Haloplanus vescus]
MPSTTRRALLGTAGVALCGSLAGCGAGDSPSKLDHLAGHEPR